MLETSLPWWEFALRVFVVYAALLVMIRLSGKRTIGQFTPFDLLVMLLLSETVSNALSGGDASLVGGLIAAGTLVAINGVVGLLTAHSRRIERLVEGEAVLLGRNGQIYDALLKRHRVGRDDVDRALREAGCRVQDMRCLFLESNGSLTVLRRAGDSGE